MPVALLFLALGTFAIGTESFLIAGLLTGIADDLAVSVVAAGHLVTSFAVTYAIGAPIMATLTGSLDRRTVLLLSLGIFTLANVAAALAPSYPALLGLRTAMAVFSCLYTPAASALAASLVPVEQRGRALAFVASGITVATALGVPLGTAIGGAFGWRASFLAVAVLALAAWLGILFGLKKMAASPALPLRDRLAPLGRAAVRHALLMSAAWTAGAFTLYIYLSAYFAPLGLGGAALAGILAVFGAGAFIGNLAGGWAADRFGPPQVIASGLFLLAAIFLGFSLAYELPQAAAISIVLLGLWAVIGWSVLPARQAQLIALAPQSAPLLLALNASAIYLGMAVGSVLGAVTLAQGGPRHLGWVGATVELVALALLAAERRRTPILRPVPAG